jgi:hypothetical protein
VKSKTDAVLAQADAFDFIWRAKRPRKTEGFSRFCPNLIHNKIHLAHTKIIINSNAAIVYHAKLQEECVEWIM